MEQKLNKLLLMGDVLELSPSRKLADAIVQLMTKDQLNTLKSHLQFNPQKLPLTTQALEEALQQGDESTFDLIHQRYSKLIDAFESLVLPTQLEALHGYAEYLSEQLKQADNYIQVEQLEELYFLLRVFLDNAETQQNCPPQLPAV